MKLENKLSFERKISFEPLLTSIFLGIVVAIIVYSIFPKLLILSVVIGIIAFLTETLLIYPNYLINSYGYWQIGSKGIYYYDYSTWVKRIQAIYLPKYEKTSELPFSDIEKISIESGKSIMNTQNPSGGDLRTPLTRRISYFVIQTGDRNVKLNCAWRSTGIPITQSDIKDIFNLLNSKI